METQSPRLGLRPRFHLLCVIKLLAVVLIAIGLTSCAEDDFDETPSQAGNEANRANEENTNNPIFHDQLLAVANEYFEYGLVNPAPRMAITLCRQPPRAPMLSESDDSNTHGKKLYFLFAKNSAHYLRQDNTDSPIGQAFVKEAWKVIPQDETDRQFTHPSGKNVSSRATIGSKQVMLGDQHHLFIMLKTDSDTPETDQGWIYGVIDSQSKEVLGSGKIQSCIECHLDAKHDRLFGPAFK